MNYKGLSRMVSRVMDGKIINPKFLRLMRNAGLVCIRVMGIFIYPVMCMMYIVGMRMLFI